jgi:hypothetical protein
MSVSCTLNTAPHQQNFTLHETLRREKERVSPWWNLWAQFHMRWKLCETPIKTQIEFHHATMQLNHKMRERLWDPWAYETVQWNYALRETSISYQSFTSWKPGRWNSSFRLALQRPYFLNHPWLLIYILGRKSWGCGERSCAHVTDWRARSRSA